MQARNIKFRAAVANTYCEKCPELSRMMMMKCLADSSGSLVDDSSKTLHESSCQHCGTVFTASNCTFRIKPKRQYKKKKEKSGYLIENSGKHDNREVYIDLPKHSNYLQILCKYCGWKRRHVGTNFKRKSEGKSKSKESKCTEPQTPVVSETSFSITTNLLPIEKSSGSPSMLESPSSMGNGQKSKKKSKKKPKTKLKALLAMERASADCCNSPSPCLMSFLDRM